jgi:hypothetical protein
MSRPVGSKNRRTLLRDPRHIIDMVYIMEESATFFYRRAVVGLKLKRKQDQIDADYEKASHLASLAAPYRHPRLSAVKLAGDPNNPSRIRDDATADELRGEILKHMGILIDGGLSTCRPSPSFRHCRRRTVEYRINPKARVMCCGLCGCYATPIALVPNSVPTM